MASVYEEVYHGEALLRFPPGRQHEMVCDRLHQRVAEQLPLNSSLKLLPRRSRVLAGLSTALRPDLAIVRKADERLWLAAEVINPKDHQVDTVIKKSVYQEIALPRLWMIDPRYENIEVYRNCAFGLRLELILSGQESLCEPHFSSLAIPVKELFFD
jgi:Uma2 family endonuclease